MEFLDESKLWLFVFLFLPGFVSVKVNGLLIASERYDFSKNLLEIVGYSLLNLIVFSWLIMLNISKGWLFYNSFWFYLSLFLVFIAGPVLWPVLFDLLLKKSILKRYLLSGTKTAWDSVFCRKDSFYVIIYLKDGRKIGGKYGMNSYASAYPMPERIFLEEVYLLNDDGGFSEAVQNTAGVLIVSDEIDLIQLFKTKKDE